MLRKKHPEFLYLVEDNSVEEVVKSIHSKGTIIT